MAHRPGYGRRLVVMALMLWAAYAPHCIDNGCSNKAVQKLMANCCLKRQCTQLDLNVIVKQRVTVNAALMFVLIARQLDRVPGLEGRTGAQSA